MRHKTLALTAVVIAILLGWQFWPDILRVAAPDFVKSQEARGVYFRLLAKYRHGGEIINFDIVAGCGVRVTRYGDGSSSYDASLDPRIFAKATRDGGAIWQIVPSACLRETTANGKVPKDFLPGAVWFDSKDDFSFGVAYVTEDAFENPKSKLEFLGASILAATREEWKAFQPEAKENLINPKRFGRGVYQPTPEEIAANLWNREVLANWRPITQCYLVQRYQITDETAIAAIQEYRPDSQPRFWTLPDDRLKALEQRIFSRDRGGVEVRGFPSSSYFDFGTHSANAFPTRARGGMLYSGNPWDQLPAEIYPIRMGDGIPWLTPDLASANPIYSDVDLDRGANRGFAYCYRRLSPLDSFHEAHFPGYRQRNFVTRVDGVPILMETEADRHFIDRPRMFFEGDDTYYLRKGFGF